MKRDRNNAPTDTFKIRKLVVPTIPKQPLCVPEIPYGNPLRNDYQLIAIVNAHSGYEMTDDPIFIDMPEGKEQTTIQAANPGLLCYNDVVDVEDLSNLFEPHVPPRTIEKSPFKKNLFGEDLNTLLMGVNSELKWMGDTELSNRHYIRETNKEMVSFIKCSGVISRDRTVFANKEFQFYEQGAPVGNVTVYIRNPQGGPPIKYRLFTKQIETGNFNLRKKDLIDSILHHFKEVDHMVIIDLSCSQFENGIPLDIQRRLESTFGGKKTKRRKSKRIKKKSKSIKKRK